jgi:hypothetical protein
MDLAIDRMAISTELKTSNPVMVTLTGSNGFSGDVALAVAVVDANNAPIPGWTVDLSAPSMTLAAMPLTPGSSTRGYLNRASADVAGAARGWDENAETLACRR